MPPALNMAADDWVALGVLLGGQGVGVGRTAVSSGRKPINQPFCCGQRAGQALSPAWGLFRQLEASRCVYEES